VQEFEQGKNKALKEGNKKMTENNNTEGELFGPEVINQDAIEELSDEIVDELLAMLTKAGY
jgi:hypothetical protein